MQILNDLSFVVVPVDQKKAEFKTLVRLIKRQLEGDNQLAMQYNYELVEALCKMRVDTLNDLMREMMHARKLSRGSKDISAQMLYFTQLCKQHEQDGDQEILHMLVKELQYLAVTDLRIEQINYIMKAFANIAALCERGSLDKNALKKPISDFLPRLMEQIESDLYRSKVSDVITLAEGYSALFDAQIITSVEHSKVHMAC